jgi:class 3 adenylate cyclase
MSVDAAGMRSLTCFQPPRRLPPWALALIALAGVLAAIASAGALYYACWYGLGATPAFVRTIASARKRIRGAPEHVRARPAAALPDPLPRTAPPRRRTVCEAAAMETETPGRCARALRQQMITNAHAQGRLSLVITDVEGFSKLMAENPEAATAALSAHNGVLRAAAWAAAGYVLEQEGDSFTIVFYEAADAAQFALQAQQALMRVKWPAELLRGAGSAAPTHRESQGARLRRRLMSAVTGRKAAAAGATDSGSSDGRRALASLPSLPLPLPLLPSRGADSLPHFGVSVPAGGASGSAGGGSAGGGPERISSSRSSAGGMLFRGLRVRMGIATGFVRRGKDLRNSAVMRRCRIISDAANGGQARAHEAPF